MTGDLKHPHLSAASERHPLADRVVARYYELLDSGTVRAAQGYAGGVAVSAVAGEFNVPPKTVWRWIRENTG